MKITKRIFSLITAIALLVTIVPFTVSEVSAVNVAADSSLVIKRPVASVYVTDVTRVAFAQNSMKQPSGSNSVIVSATPSGMPQLNSSFPQVAYAGETPTATQIAFTPGVELSVAPTISCSNPTVTLSNYTYSNGTYSWYVTGGTATVGTTLIFTVSYTYADYNSITGKYYERLYSSYGVSYVEAIAVPAGEYSTKRTYEDFFFGQSTKNRSYVASYILGANTYGTLYNNGAGEGSVFFESTNAAPGWTTDYGMMHTSEGHSADRDYNIAYHADDNRPISYVYFDRSIHSTLSDLNLRIVASNLDEAKNEGERVTVSVRNNFVSYGIVNTYANEKDNSTLSTNSFAEGEIGLAKYSGSIYGAGATFNQYFTGSGPSAETGVKDYTVTVKYQTAAGWNEVFIGHSLSLSIITVDKGALRTLVENIQGTDPTVMTTDLASGDFKGYNPQEWYYASGWEAFLNEYKSAMACIKKPTATQDEINTAYNNLKTAYDGLVLRTADYSIASAYHSQALAKNSGNYTLSSWAKVQNILDNYVSNYSAIYQPALDKVAADLKFALDSLEEARADYTQFNAHLKTINNLMSRAVANYGMTAAEAYNNWNKLEDTLRRTGCIYDELEGYVVGDYLLISSQATVNGYVLQLERAINALSLKTANYTEASKAEAAYKAINLSYLTPDSEVGLTEAYNALVALKGRDMSYQSQIDAATAALNAKLDNLSYKPADTTAALQMIARANSLDRTQYEDMSAVDQAVANLEAKLNLDIRYQNDINRATSQLQSAIDSLNMNSADYSSVEDAIALVSDRETLIKDTYADTYGFTAEMFYANWSNVTKAVNSVVYGLDFTQQATVDSYATAIINALNSLTESTADYTQVKIAQDEAYNIVTTGTAIYTEASLDRLTAAYTAVVANKPISEQATVDGYAAAINEAIAQLQYLPADYTQVNKQLQLAQEKINLNNEFEAAHNGHTYFTKETIDNLETVVASVATDLDMREQETVDSYEAALIEALALLKIGPADYTEVDNALARVPSDLSLYTTLSVATLNATTKNINRTYTADKQATVDRYVTSINNAIANLKFKAADYTSVNAAKSAAEAEIASGLYTADSVAELQAVLDSVNYALTIDKQDEVEAYANMIYDAMENLQRKGPEIAALEEAIRIAEEEIAKGIYTEESVYALNSPLSTAKTEIGNASPNLYNQAYVDMLTTLITDLTASLEKKPADYTAVLEVIERAEAEIESEKYTLDSVEELQAVIESVDYTLTIDRQAEVDLYEIKINKAIDSLELKSLDYSKFDEALIAADTEINTGLYTDESVEELTEVIRYATQQLSDGTPTQELIDQMAELIVSNISVLKLKPADYARVEYAVSLAESEIERGWYTDESVEYLRWVISQVDYTLTIDRQAEVDAYAQMVFDAIEALERTGPDLGRLLAVIDEAEYEISKGIYTKDSVDALQTAVDSAKWQISNGSLQDQSRVNLLIANIEKLIQSLNVRSADYTAVENAITAAYEKILKDWYTEDSVALLQAEIDKVEYGLDITRQDEVILFANNIVNLTNELQLKLADYTELQKILDLLDNSDSEIYTNTYKNFNEVMSQIISYRENVVSQNMNLTIDKQAQVNEMTATLQGYIDSLIPVEPVVLERFEIVGGATVTKQAGVNYIIGLQPSLTKAKFQSTYANYENVTIEYDMTTARYMGTGSTITVKSSVTGEVIAEYVIVIYGDVDGTATINARDVLAIKNSVSGGATLTGAAKLAANVEGSRATINAKDAEVLNSVVSGSMVIDQTTGKGTKA